MSEVLLSADLLENCMAEDLLRPVLDTGIGFTNDGEEIRARNGELRLLEGNAALWEACRVWCAKYGDLTQITRLNAPDAQQIFSILPLFREFYRAMEDFSGIVSADPALAASASLARIADDFAAVCREEFPPDFKEKWKKMLSGLADIHSLTYRFTLNDELQVTQYSLLAVEDEAYARRGLLARMDARPKHDMEMLARNMGTYTNQYLSHEAYSMTPSATAPSAGAIRQAGMLFSKEVRDNRLADIRAVLMTAMPALYAQQDKALWETVRALGSRLLRRLEGAYGRIRFWLEALRLMETVRGQGLPLTYPAILPAESRTCQIKGAYHPAVALHLANPGRVVCNDICLDEKQQLLVITGMNGGGKTTYLRTVGVQQLFFQLGLPLPAQEARLSPVDAIVCAFSQREDTRLSSGKLGQELDVLRRALRSVTGHSLVLLNEPITGTSVSECCLLSREIFAVLTLLGVRGIWVTHLYALLGELEGMGEALQGSPAGFLHLEEGYRVLPGKGGDHSHARELFRQTILVAK